jgi:DNA-binding transcriptional regulator GbsR (MarR family)
MTEITEHTEGLPDPIRRFVLHWGNMGDRWGVNRSVSQVHALLYVAERPLTAEEIADLLTMARSNVSTSLRELMSWQLVRRVPVLGDRRDHFEAETDLWTMVTRIAAGRKARELDPAAAALRDCLVEARADPRVGPAARRAGRDAGFRRATEPVVRADAVAPESAGDCAHEARYWHRPPAREARHPSQGSGRVNPRRR